MAVELRFSEVAGLINHSRTTKIDLSPALENDHWASYQGHHRIHTATYAFTVLYLRASCTKDALKEAVRKVYVPSSTHVVYASSLAERHGDLLSKLFEKSPLGLWTPREYLASFMKDELDNYINELAAITPRYYVDPPFKTPSGFRKVRPNPLYSLLTETDPGCGPREGMLGILLAEPGQGKTYLSQYLVSRLSKVRTLVPIYIHSAQWTTIPLEDLGSIWKTIAHSFRYFGSTISWLEGHEDEFVRVTLKAKLFRIVFDGFDEYVLWNKGRVRARDTLDTLSNLVKDTGARIVVTSRTSFWESNILDEGGETLRSQTKFAYRLQPFDHQHAKHYFTKRFGEEDSRATRAVTFHDAIKKSAHQFAGRGFVLNLLADLSEQDQATTSSPVARGNGLDWVMAALCEREILRQQLALTAQQQVHALQVFALEVVAGADPDSEMLELAIQEAAPQMAKPERADCLEKLQSHPLLDFKEKDDRWGWKQEQIQNVLLAQHFISLAGDPGTTPRVLSRFFQKPRGSAAESDFASMIVDVVRTPGGDDQTKESIQTLINVLLLVDRDEAASRWQNDAIRLAVTIAVVAVDRILVSGSSHTARTSLFVKLCQGPVLKNLPISGALARMDFSGITFDRCRFERVTWANCKFDSTTVFDRCYFVGGNSVHCTQFGVAQFRDIIADREAATLIATAQVNAGRRDYSKADLRNDIVALVTKFITRGGLGLKSIEAAHLKKGTVSQSRYRDELIDGLLGHVIEPHEISGFGEGGYHIKSEAEDAVKFFAANNSFTGPLKQVFDRLVAKLKLLK